MESFKIFYLNEIADGSEPNFEALAITREQFMSGIPTQYASIVQSLLETEGIQTIINGKPVIVMGKLEDAVRGFHNEGLSNTLIRSIGAVRDEGYAYVYRDQ